MKKYQTTAIYTRRNYKHARNILERNLASKEKRKRKGRGLQGVSSAQRKQSNLSSQYTRLVAPQNFSFIDDPESTIKFLIKLENLYLKRKSVFVDLSGLKCLDHSAVTVLVSVMFSFKSRNIAFNGNFPSDDKLARRLINSGFFKYLGKPIGNKIEYTIGKENQIFARANKEVNSELGLVVMAEASTTIWGNNRTCKGLQRTLLELMQNTNNHADIGEKGAKHWWLSVNHNKEEKRVSFYFVDYGVGIFESLKSKPPKNKWFGWWDKIKTKLIHGGDDEILRLLLNGDMHMTVTGQHFRGKGLPGIKEVQDRNQISNLKIISNDVFADVAKSSYYKLSNNFSGTFVTWELTQNNVNSPWII
jgi:hypothetical protein